jgi:probable rRNA maturation factor
MKIETDLSISCQDWCLRSEINNETIINIINLVLSRFKNLQDLRVVKISVLLSNNSYMKFLNKTYLNKDKPTNVLAFPEFDFHYKTVGNFESKLGEIHLGSIVFGYQILVKEASEKSISILRHFAHLLIHGLLHLLGYNHDKNEEAEVMESLEQDILSQFCNNF